MTTIAEAFIELGREEGREEMEQEVQKALWCAQRAHQEVQKVRLEMVQELQRAYQEARNSIRRLRPQNGRATPLRSCGG